MVLVTRDAKATDRRRLVAQAMRWCRGLVAVNCLNVGACRRWCASRGRAGGRWVQAGLTAGCLVPLCSRWAVPGRSFAGLGGGALGPGAAACSPVFLKSPKWWAYETYKTGFRRFCRVVTWAFLIFLGLAAVLEVVKAVLVVAAMPPVTRRSSAALEVLRWGQCRVPLLRVGRLPCANCRKSRNCRSRKPQKTKTQGPCCSASSKPKA